MISVRYVIRNNYSGAFIHKSLFRIRAFRTESDAFQYMRIHGLNARFYEVITII